MTTSKCNKFVALLILLSLHRWAKLRWNDMQKLNTLRKYGLHVRELHVAKVLLSMTWCAILLFLVRNEAFYYLRSFKKPSGYSFTFSFPVWKMVKRYRVLWNILQLHPNKYSHWFSVGKHFILMFTSNKYIFKRDFVPYYLFSIWKINVLLSFSSKHHLKIYQNQGYPLNHIDTCTFITCITWYDNDFSISFTFVKPHECGTYEKGLYVSVTKI